MEWKNLKKFHIKWGLKLKQTLKRGHKKNRKLRQTIKTKNWKKKKSKVKEEAETGKCRIKINVELIEFCCCCCSVSFSLFFPLFFFLLGSEQRSKKKQKKTKHEKKRIWFSIWKQFVFFSFFCSSLMFVAARPLFLEPVYAASLSLFSWPRLSVSFYLDSPSLSHSWVFVGGGDRAQSQPASQPPRIAGIVLFQG